MYKGLTLGLFAIPRTVPAYNQKLVDLQTNFMSYPEYFINTRTPEGQRKLQEYYRNPGAATRGQIAAIMRYYSSGYLNNDDKEEQ